MLTEAVAEYKDQIDSWVPKAMPKGEFINEPKYNQWLDNLIIEACAKEIILNKNVKFGPSIKLVVKVANKALSQFGLPKINLRRDKEHVKLASAALFLVNTMDDLLDKSLDKEGSKHPDQIYDGLMSTRLNNFAYFSDYWDMLNFLIKNSSTYTSDEKKSIETDIDLVATEGLQSSLCLKELGDKASFDTVWSLKTLGFELLNRLVFDILVSNPNQNKLYELAREKSYPTIRGLQILDDSTDIVEDKEEGTANIFVSAARLSGEYEILEKAIQNKRENLLELIPNACKMIRQRAKKEGIPIFGLTLRGLAN